MRCRHDPDARTRFAPDPRRTQRARDRICLGAPPPQKSQTQKRRVGPRDLRFARKIAVACHSGASLARGLIPPRMTARTRIALTARRDGNSASPLLLVFREGHQIAVEAAHMSEHQPMRSPLVYFELR